MILLEHVLLVPRLGDGEFPTLHHPPGAIVLDVLLRLAHEQTVGGLLLGRGVAVLVHDGGAGVARELLLLLAKLLVQQLRLGRRRLHVNLLTLPERLHRV